jgi:glycosyltransferase involved in cell wall biosynthesis
MTEPLVSIVVPCYRGRTYLRQAIESCLRQTHRNLEVIAVDDLSPDADYELAEDMARSDNRIRVVRRSENGGIGRALNSGFAAAKGDYFTRLAQDDLFREDALALLVRAIQTHPEAGLVYSDMQLIDADGKYMQMMHSEPPERALLPANRVGLCVMWPRRVWDAVGPFDPAYDLCDDYEFFLRISRQFPLFKVEGEAPFFFRYHAGQGSITKEKAHDVVRCRVQLAHHRALLRQRRYSVEIWKRIVSGRLRLLACQTGLYQYWKYDGRTLFKGRRR